jgi:hypothetical protein
MTAAYPSLAANGWHPPQDLVDLVATYPVVYDDAPPWNGGSGCAGRAQPGTLALKDYLLAHFPGIREIQPYHCRANTAAPQTTSMHGTGRGFDVMTGDPEPNVAVGDVVAEWLVRNAVGIGVQYLIWNRTAFSRSAPRGRFSAYTGPVPHTDHVHCEITLAAGAQQTPFFTGIWPQGTGTPSVAAPWWTNTPLVVGTAVGGTVLLVALGWAVLELSTPATPVRALPPPWPPRAVPLPVRYNPRRRGR